MVEYYDLLLVSIPTVVLVGVLASIHPAVAIHQGLAAGSLVSTVILIEALYRNPPAQPGRPARAARYSVVGAWLLTIVLYL